MKHRTQDRDGMRIDRDVTIGMDDGLVPLRSSVGRHPSTSAEIVRRTS